VPLSLGVPPTARQANPALDAGASVMADDENY
jgi:hypothetical protein